MNDTPLKKILSFLPKQSNKTTLVERTEHVCPILVIRLILTPLERKSRVDLNVIC